MKNREELKFLLKQLFKHYNYNRTIYKKMLYGIRNRMPLGKFAEFFTTDNELEVTDEELYWMAKLFKREYDMLEEKTKLPIGRKLVLSNYFSKTEMFRAEAYILISAKKSDVLTLKGGG